MDKSIENINMFLENIAKLSFSGQLQQQLIRITVNHVFTCIKYKETDMKKVKKFLQAEF